MKLFCTTTPLGVLLVTAITISRLASPIQAQIDCSEYQTSFKFNNMPITLQYVLNYDDNEGVGTFEGEVSYEGQGWVGFGISEAGRMIGSVAWMGFPGGAAAETNGHYWLNGFTPADVTLSTEDGILTSSTSSIVQNDTHSTLTFTIPVQAQPASPLEINPSGSNNFLVAAGYFNSLGPHIYRASAPFTLSPCDPSGTTATAATTTTATEEEQQQVVPSLQVGDDITVEGYLMDHYCINNGFLLDAPEISTFDQPFLHSLHCLVDETPCLDSPYEILLDPIQSGQPYTRGYRLDDYGKARLIQLARDAGGQRYGCTTCVSENGLEKGFRVQVAGSIVSLPTTTADGEHVPIPTISVSSVRVARQIDCSAFEVSHVFTNNVPMSIHYVVNYDDDLGTGEFIGEVIYEGQGWVGFGISEDGLMTGAVAVIGFPDEPLTENVNPGIYDMQGKIPQAVLLYDENSATEPPITLRNSSIFQNDTHTILSMTIPIQKPFFHPLEIDPFGQNNFIVAAGMNNMLGFHKYRSGLSFDRSVCGQTNDKELEIGDVLVIEGYVMDYFSINDGVLFDMPSVVTLQEPYLQSFHCLADAEQCLESPYEILVDPAVEGGLYTRGYRLDEESKQKLIQLARETGSSSSGCTTCINENSGMERGFRVAVAAEIISLATTTINAEDGSEDIIPPIIRITDMRVVESLLPLNDAGVTADDSSSETTTTATTTTSGVVDCTQYQVSHKYEGLPLTLNYVVNVDEVTGVGTFSGQVIYEGLGWLAFAISETGMMAPALAVIGLPDEPLSESNPGKYDMTSQALAGVTLKAIDQQTLINATIEQDETTTTLTFTKLVEEPDEIPIDITGGSNFFLVAAGPSNSLDFHIYRGSVGLSASQCTSEGGGGGGDAIVISTNTMKSSFVAHGVLTAVAWAILAPLAIGNALLRNYIPGAGLWFKLHRAFNTIVLVFTIIGFAVVVYAMQKASGGGNPGHFKPGVGVNGNHRIIGLVVFILTIIQSIGGAMRPHLPPPPDADGNQEEKTTIRKMWEILHRGSGFAILFMAWYQVHSGLVLYSRRFASMDLSFIFWIVVGILSGIILIGYIMRIVTGKKK